MTYSDAIIKRLTDLCVERGITTNKLATLSGITQSTLNSMMRGETKNPKLQSLDYYLYNKDSLPHHSHQNISLPAGLYHSQQRKMESKHTHFLEGLIKP